MKKFLIFGVGGGAVLLIAVAMLSRYIGYVYHHPQGKVFVVTETGAVVDPDFLEEKERREKLSATAKRHRLKAVAVCDEREFHFGVMDPLSMGEHTFVIKSTGQAPLELRNAGTTCKCTISNLSGDFLEPGEEAQVKLQWNSGREPDFIQSAVIATNDPSSPTIELRVMGHVRVRLASTAQQFDFKEIEPESSQALTTVVYSQLWEDFEITRINSSVEGLTWRVTPASEAVQEAHDARRAFEVTVISPPAESGTELQGRLWIEVEARDREDKKVTELIDLPVEGEVLKRFRIFGAGIDSSGVIDLGIFPQGRGAEVRLTIKLRDEVRELNLTGTAALPPFATAELFPQGPPGLGLYTLVVSIPEDAPKCHHLGSRMGQLQLRFDHPRIKEIDLKLNFGIE